MKLPTRLATMLMAGTLAAGAAGARDLRIAPGVPPAHPAHSHLYEGLVEYLPEESEGALTASILGPEVVSLGQMKDALQTGLADVGNLLPLYFPAELPNMALAGELSLSAVNPHAVAAAITEYTVTCDSCQTEMNDFDVVYLGSGSSDPYVLMTNTPVESADDLEGLRLRSGGAPFSRWAENFGAVPVSIGVGDTFEAMSQGTIDGTMASVGDLLSFRLVDLVTHVTEVPLGAYFSTSNFTVATSTWGELSADERAALVRAANRANADFTYRWGYDFPQAARAAAEEAGIEFLQADEDFVEASRDFAAADRDTAAELSAERFGMDDASERVAEFMDLVEKWRGINEEVGDDPEAMAQAMWDEIWSQVDFASYGE
ncbi:C4-dicarboxylate ABC transporter substrate-binding protein [Rhodobacteraceae bacterium WD3A24]|nr:C4-dicarboxylate ABC transporter substrate-binding protein [Rhodobacteraceae bacterium WD3A24]